MKIKQRIQKIIFISIVGYFLNCTIGEACTSAIISGKNTPDGRPLMWKNRDTDDLSNCVIAIKGEKYDYVAIVKSNAVRTKHIPSVWIGTNEAGFSIMNTLSYNIRSSEYNNQGSRNGSLMKRALEICESVEDFKHFLDTLSRPMLVCSNYGVIDAKGGASYFEVDNYKAVQYDVNDKKVAPKGFLVRTNYSEHGAMNKGMGYVRYQQVDEMLTKAIPLGIVTPQWLFANLSRSFVNPLMGIDLTNVYFNKPQTNGWFCEEDFIARRKSTCAVTIKGVKPGEKPELTTMWTVIGYPPVTPAIPVWAKDAKMILPNCLVYNSLLNDSPLCAQADSLRSLVYSYHKGDNADAYFNWKLLYNIQGSGYMQQLSIFESSLFMDYNQVIEKFYNKGKLDSKVISELYQNSTSRIDQFYKGLIDPSDSVKRETTIGREYLKTEWVLYDSIQKKLHAWAELGFLENNSSSLFQKQLESNGFNVEKGVAGMPTAFIATYGKGKPVIGLLAEFDALPGMSQDTVPYQHPMQGLDNGHACGHNLLGTGSLAAVIAISKWLAEGHSGTVCLYGCPAEEGGSGKAYLVREHCFDSIDVVLDWHPSSENSVNVKSGLANVQIDFRFQGKSAHASSAPEKGRSALDGVESFNYMMNMMREHVPMTSRIHYIITNGGKSPNVVPDFAEVEYFLRSPKRAIVEELKQRAVKAAEGAAMGTETKMTYEIKSGNYERLYNATLSRLIQKNMELVGGVIYNEQEQIFAEEILKNSGVSDMSVLNQVTKVKPLESEKETLTGASSDVGNVSWVVPTGSFGTATFVPCGGGHCWQQTACGGMSIGTKGMMNAAEIFYLTALCLYQNPVIVEQIKQEFERRRGKDFQFVPLIGDRKPPLDYRLPRK